MQTVSQKDMVIEKVRLNLLDKLCSKAELVTQEKPLFSSISQMTRYALNASASSLLLFDEYNTELIYKFDDGPLGKQLRRLQMGKNLGIAGWVVQNSKPLIVQDINRDERFNKFIDEVIGLVMRSVICAPLIVKNKVIGVIEVINKLEDVIFNDYDLQTMVAVANTAALALENVRLNENLLHSYKSSIQELASLVDAREANAGKHSKQVSEYALIGATELSFSEHEKEIIEYAAILHDIGKLRIPESILNKPGHLTPDEWHIIREHSVIGYNLLRGIPSLNDASRLILYHHERYDGKGYPYKLKGETIPIGARLIAVADAFDNMTTNHSYRAALSNKEALSELGRYAGSQFCPVAVKKFCLGFIRSRLSQKIEHSKAKIQVK